MGARVSEREPPKSGNLTLHPCKIETCNNFAGDGADPKTIVSCQELRDGFEVRAFTPTKIGTVEEGIHEHVGGEAKHPAVMKTLWCSFCQLRSMCLSPIPSYFTEYGGEGGSRPFGKRNENLN